ncbi:Isochorismatase family protein [Rubripirellula tenax]|uniref:Isochorismatase family protein n=1 Tax=Rubripirellula tenax TaxID=2528015 RepID=A0A5C6EPQ0_9BACT|nr:isochorismatase family protein [Rubripirellula tenax]TWU50888.1 Isochorismatase family protein [Rubripirellula tenax]
MLNPLFPRFDRIALVVIAGFIACPIRSAAQTAGDATAIEMTIRYETETDPKRHQFKTVEEPRTWTATETAIVVCDMWDQHWCRGATDRVAEMAPRMNQVIQRAREQGVLIIHCPSACLDFYKGTPMRQRAIDAAQSAKDDPSLQSKTPLQGWCWLDPVREPSLPIDDTDGGCDCDPTCQQHEAWTRQIETIRIDPSDAITDSDEAFYLMKQRGIKNVIVMGVHLNMCVLGRPFSIRQMVQQGQNVVLVRDLTDTMYNSRKSPYVSHFDGTRLVTQHVERYWCPTITSTDVDGGPEFHFAAD